VRKFITVGLTVLVLALPVADAWASTKTASTKKKVVTRKFTGPVAQVDRWGTLQVTIVVRKTTVTTGKRKKVTRKITAVSVPVYPNHTDRSIFINQNALPMLRAETLTAQNAKIDLVSGATESSDAFVQSLQAAILKAKRA
jgi:uncharacterized protein with FMN-binding domain